MVDPEVQEQIAVRRSELDDLEEQLVKQLAEVRAEREDLAAAERVLARMGEQVAAERPATAPWPTSPHLSARLPCHPRHPRPGSAPTGRRRRDVRGQAHPPLSWPGARSWSGQ
ncbi:hypothetical protein [Streptomyces sp. NPDC053720]|uniref:hypothetical protein n=1 Tax=Streptomyces sp. NPDC053720 TaxID=3154855 RepID=UPI003435F7E7